MKQEDFRPLTGDASGVYQHFLAGALNAESCERSWCNLRLYADTYSWQYAEVDGRLWIASFDQKYIFFPQGREITPEDLKMSLEKFAAICSGDIVCGDIPFDYPERFPQAAELLELEFDPGDCDYIYDLEHLQSFSGSKLRKRHNQVRQFEREYAGRFESKAVKYEDLPEITALALELSKPYQASDSAAEERLALKQMNQLWRCNDMLLDGVMILLDGRVVSFSIFSKLTDQMVDVHFEKADHQYSGCGAKQTAVLTDYLLAHGYSFMNREQDLNSEGLRRAKQALDPARIYKRINTEIFLP